MKVGSTSSSGNLKIVDLDQRRVPNRVVRVGELSTTMGTNETHRTKYPLWMLPLVTLHSVRVVDFLLTTTQVFSQRQNIYFLCVGFIQVLTWSRLGVLPAYISPTGPWGTAGSFKST